MVNKYAQKVISSDEPMAIIEAGRVDRRLQKPLALAWLIAK